MIELKKEKINQLCNRGALPCFFPARDVLNYAGITYDVTDTRCY
jgi:hypothetical protein